MPPGPQISMRSGKAAAAAWTKEVPTVLEIPISPSSFPLTGHGCRFSRNHGWESPVVWRRGAEGLHHAVMKATSQVGT
jgi:hypothetical protein